MNHLLSTSRLMPMLLPGAALARRVLASRNAGDEDYAEVFLADAAAMVSLLRRASELRPGEPYDLSWSGADPIAGAIRTVGPRGTRRLLERLLVLDARARETFGGLDGMEMSAYCRGVAVVMRARFGGSNWHYAAGLLHDIGKLSLAWQAPTASRSIAERVAEGAVELELEQHLFRTTHAEHGVAILRGIPLPPGMLDAAGEHHCEAPQSQLVRALVDSRRAVLDHLAARAAVRWSPHRGSRPTAHRGSASVFRLGGR